MSDSFRLDKDLIPMLCIMLNHHRINVSQSQERGAQDIVECRILHATDGAYS